MNTKTTNTTITLDETMGETATSYSIPLLEKNGIKIVQEGSAVAFVYETPDMQEDLQSLYHLLTRKYDLPKAWSAKFLDDVMNEIKDARFEKAMIASEIPAATLQ